MTFEEKLKELRKKKNITQDELASKLYVSRTAVSKWESGKGYPSIETLKNLASFYEVTIDELVSNEEILDLSEKTIERNKQQNLYLVYGMLDILVFLLLFLPVFGMRSEDKMISVPLFQLDYTAIEIVLDLLVILSIGILGIGIIILSFLEKTKVLKYLKIISLSLGVLLIAVFLLTRQPYAGIISLGFLVVKILLILRR